MRLARSTHMPEPGGQFRQSIASLAATGSTQSDAAQIINQLIKVTASDGTKGVALPTPTESGAILVVNSVSASLVKVWPKNGRSDSINGGSANASVSLAGGEAAWFVPTSSTDWTVCAASAASVTAFLSGVTAGTVTASKAVVVDANKDAASFRNLRAARLIHAEGAPVSVSTAGVATIAAATMIAGIYVRDPNGAGRTDTFDTAANLVAALPGAAVGDIIDLLIINGADAAETITLAVPASGSFDANQTAASRVITQNTSKMVRIRLTNVTASSEAYVVYS